MLSSGGYVRHSHNLFSPVRAPDQPIEEPVCLHVGLTLQAALGSAQLRLRAAIAEDYGRGAQPGLYTIESTEVDFVPFVAANLFAMA